MMMAQGDATNDHIVGTAIRLGILKVVCLLSSFHGMRSCRSFDPFGDSESCTNPPSGESQRQVAGDTIPLRMLKVPVGINPIALLLTSFRGYDLVEDAERSVDQRTLTVILSLQVLRSA